MRSLSWAATLPVSRSLRRTLRDLKIKTDSVGIGTAHYLLRHTLPSLQKLTSAKYHVTLVSPSTHAFWKIGAPRSLASEDALPVDKVFLPISDGFKSYPAESYGFVQGAATGLNEGNKTVIVTKGSSTTELPYNTLVIATGTTSNSALWTLHGEHEISIQAFKDLHAALPGAKTILIAGGGPAGTETAGEIAQLQPKAKTTLLSGGARLLPRLKPATSADAQKKLESMGVEVLHNVKVSRSNLVDGKTYATELGFDNGETRNVDIYIDATGGKPNTGFLPQSWLTDSAKVDTDAKTCRSTKAEGVYAVGDVGSYSHGGFLDVRDGVPVACSSIAIDIAAAHSQSGAVTQKTTSKRTDSPASTTSYIGWFFSLLYSWVFFFLTARVTDERPAVPKQKYYKWLPDSQFVPIGSKQGVGQIMGWRIPSFIVTKVKGQTFMIEKFPGVPAGADFVKA